MSEPLRMAIGQLRVHWTGAENTAAIVDALAQAAAAGARVCVVPELALTGFHRQVRTEAQPALVQAWIGQVFWPGAMRPAVDGSDPDPDGHVKRAGTQARRIDSWLVQANWPNALNRPEESEFGGQSVVVDPSGEVRLRLPVAKAGVGIFDLGARVFDRVPQSL